MQKQKSLTGTEISAHFTKISERQIADLEQSGVGSALRHLSASIRAMQDAGIDIAIDMHKGQYSDAYDMMFTTLEPKSGYIPAYGFISSGGATKLIAIVSRVEDHTVCKVLVSDHVSGSGNSRLSWSGSNKVPAKAYHLDKDENALASLQASLISFAADRHAVQSFDSESVFGKSAPQNAQIKGKSALRRPSR